MKDTLEYKKHKKRQKHLFKELQSAEQGDCSVVDNWETIDMKKQLYPIGHYINNREEMIRQVFTVIQGDRLKKMLPPVLKDMDLDNLKADCLIHLVGMSSKRIKAILEGCELDVSSDETDSDTIDHSAASSTNKDVRKRRSTSTRSSTAVSNSGEMLEDGCSIISGDDMLEIGLSNSELCDDFFESKDDSKSPKIKRKKLKRLHHQQTQQQAVSSTGITNYQSEDESSVQKLRTSLIKDNDKETKDEGDENGENKGKTLLEIIELEMRARAIRALLKHDDSPSDSPSSSMLQKQNNNSSSSIVGSVASEIIDLTSVNDQICESEKGKDEVRICTYVKSIEKVNNDTSSKVKELKNSEMKDNISKDNIDKADLQNNSMKTTKTVSNKEQINLVSSDEEGSKNVKDIKGQDLECDISFDHKSVSVDDNNDRCDQVVVTSNNKSDDGGSSWAQRWLDKKSKDVKRLVTTSKMCTTIRNKMKRSKLNSSAKLKSSQNKDIVQQAMPPEFKGSIDEYNMLKIGSNKQQSPKEDIQKGSQKVMCTTDLSSDDKLLTEAQSNSSDVSDAAETSLIETNQSCVDDVLHDSSSPGKD